VSASAIDVRAAGTQQSRGGGAFLQPGLRLALLAVLVLLIAGPLLILLLTSVTPTGSLPFQTTNLTLDHFRAIITGDGTFRLLINTLIYASSSVAMGIFLAVGLAWLTERTDLPGRTLIRILMFSWMAVPPLVFGYGWILLINPGNGAVNVFLRALFGLKPGGPLSPYSIWALIGISGASLVPTAYIMISGLLRNMDPVLEDAGSVLGAARWRVIRRITVPLLAPGLLSVFIFLGMAMVQTFDLPLIVGMTARVPVLSTRIFMASSPDSGVPDYGIAAAFGVLLLVLAMALMWGYFRVIRFGERYRVVSGKGFRPKRATLGPIAKTGALVAVAVYFVLMILPLLILFWVSLLPFYQQPSLKAFGDVSFAAYAAVLGEPQVRRAIGNTILLFFSSATIVMAMSSLISWFSVRDKGRIGRWLDILSFAPIAIPPIVLAIALLLVFLGTPLYGTIWVLVIGHVTVYLSFGTRTMNGALIQIDRELENAALISGASWATSLRRVVLPLVWPHLLNGWLWVVAHSARDLTFALILLTSSNIIASASIYMMWDQPDLPGGASLSVLLVAGLMALVVPIQIYASRSIDAKF
jgi:iron(III) transport system permease protein